MKKKIYLFDSWSFGFQYFESYVPYLLKAGFDVVMLTMDSIQYSCLDNKKADELKEYCKEVNEKITVIDLSVNESISRLGKDIPYPDVVLHLSISHLENRLINLLFENKKIKKVYAQHGNIFDVGGAKKTAKSQSVAKTIFSKKFFFKIKKIIWLFKQYLKYSTIVHTYPLVFEWFFSPREFVWLPQQHSSLHIDKAFSFSEPEKKALSNIYNIPMDNIHVIVNPEIYKLSRNLSSSSDKVNKIVFIDQALVESDLLGIEEQQKDYNLCRKIAKKHNLEFVVRPHPRTVMSNFSERSIKFESKPLSEMLESRNIYIGYNSSLIKTLLFLGMDVIHLANNNDYRTESILLEGELDFFQGTYFKCTKSDQLEECLLNILSKKVGVTSSFPDPNLQVCESILDLL